MANEAKKHQKCGKCKFYIYDGREKCTWYGKEKSSWKEIYSGKHILPWWCPLDKEEAIEMGIISEYDKSGRKRRHLPNNFEKVIEEEQEGRMQSYEAAKSLNMSLKTYERERNSYLAGREKNE